MPVLVVPAEDAVTPEEWKEFAARDCERREAALPPEQRPGPGEVVCLIHEGPDQWSRYTYTLLSRGYNPNADRETVLGQVFFARPREKVTREFNLRGKS